MVQEISHPSKRVPPSKPSVTLLTIFRRALTAKIGASAREN